MRLRNLVTQLLRPATGGRAPAVKTSKAGPVIAWSQVGQPRWTPRRFENLAEEGFRKNVIAYRCVMQIATAGAAIPWLLYNDRGEEIDRHPILDLLRHPNPLQDGVSFLENVYAYLEISGNAYIEAVRSHDDDAPVELYALRPDRMKVVPGPTGLPQAYQYTVNGQMTQWSADPVTGASNILHLKRFHPLDDWYGMPPMEAAAISIDQHNAAGSWNQALLNHGARPSGALVFAPKDGPATLSDDQMRRLREELGMLHQGDKNAGRPLILEGGLDWREMSLSPKDMDWLAGRNAAARDIALAFGVPAQLVGVPDSQTYANMAEARLAFYEETILPLVTRVIAGFDHWLTPMYPDHLELDFDPDSISALSAKRDAQWSKVQNATFLTRNEQREAVGYGPLPGSDDAGADDSDDPDPAAKYRSNHGKLADDDSDDFADQPDDSQLVQEMPPFLDPDFPGETELPETVDPETQPLPGMGGRPLPQNPFDLLDQGYEDITHPDAAENGHYHFRNPQTGDELRFDEGDPDEDGFGNLNHYHRYNPDSTGTRDMYLDQYGNPVKKGSPPSHLLPSEIA